MLGLEMQLCVERDRGREGGRGMRECWGWSCSCVFGAGLGLGLGPWLRWGSRQLGHVLFVIVEVPPVLYEEVHAVLHALAVLFRVLYVELADYLDGAAEAFHG